MKGGGGRRRSNRAEAGLESLLHYQPTHSSVEDNMKEAVHMLDLLAPDQRKGFLRLFGQFVQQRQKPTVEWARLEPPPPEAVVQATDIPPCPKDQALRHELLDKMVILKLNGEGSAIQLAVAAVAEAGMLRGWILFSAFCGGEVVWCLKWRSYLKDLQLKRM